MYKIKVDTGLLADLSKDYSSTFEVLCEVKRKMNIAEEMLTEQQGFASENLCTAIANEAAEIQKLSEKIIDLKSVTAHTAEIYEKTDHKVSTDVNSLPVMIHGNITASAKDVLFTVNTDRISIPKVKQSRLISDNTVMYEDWMIKLIAEDFIKEERV